MTLLVGDWRLNYALLADDVCMSVRVCACVRACVRACVCVVCTCGLIPDASVHLAIRQCASGR